MLLTIAKLLEGYEEAKYLVLRDEVHETLSAMLVDPVPEVRASVVYALCSMFTASLPRSETRNTNDRIAMLLIQVCMREHVCVRVDVSIPCAL